MQTPLIKEIYLHIHFVYWMRKVFFRNNRKFFNWLFQCTRMQFYLSNFSTWLTCYLILLSKILIIYIQKNLLLAAAFIGLFFSFLTTLLPYYCRLVIGAIIHHQGRTWYTVMCKHLKKVQFEEISKAKVNIFLNIFSQMKSRCHISDTFPFHLKKLLSIYWDFDIL